MHRQWVHSIINLGGGLCITKRIRDLREDKDLTQNN